MRISGNNHDYAAHVATQRWGTCTWQPLVQNEHRSLQIDAYCVIGFFCVSLRSTGGNAKSYIYLYK